MARTAERVARCRSAIALGWYPGVPTSPGETPGLHTRCSLEDDGHTAHVGKGLAAYDYQTWHWFMGDRRSYETNRGDERAWQV